MGSFVNGGNIAKDMLKSNKLPDQKEVLINKLYFVDENFLDIYLTHPTRQNKAKE